MLFGSNGGHIRLFQTGEADASFTFPTVPENLDYGSTKLEIARGMTVQAWLVSSRSATTDVDGSHALSPGDIVTAGDCSSDYLYVWQSATAQASIDGIHIQAAATLMFEHEKTAACTGRNVIVNHALVNDGSIVTGRDERDNADGLYLNVGSFYGGAGSAISLAGGAPPPSTHGGNGGNLEIQAVHAHNGLAVIWNHGSIDTSGGSGAAGGNAGSLFLWATKSLYNSGNISAKGADTVDLSHAGIVSHGGNGGNIAFGTSSGDVGNSGTLDSSGGAGSGGGDSGAVFLYGGCGGVGNLSVTGDLVAHGGDAKLDCDDETACRGGASNGVHVSASANISTSGNITTYGGNGRAGRGGTGGVISVYAQYGADCMRTTTGNNVDVPDAAAIGNDHNIPAGSIWISGNWDAHGGDGQIDGGNGGQIDVEANPDSFPLGQEIVFLGYGNGINTRGGDGAAQGGNAGSTKFYQANCAHDEDGHGGICVGPAGSVINYLNVQSQGGAASAADGAGGDGGNTQWYTDAHALGAVGLQMVINRGEVDTSGGRGVAGGRAGGVWFYGLDGVDNQGAIEARGGDADVVGGACSTYRLSEGNFGIVMFASRGPIINTAALINSGGASLALAGDGAGGNAGGVEIVGPTVQNSGAISANGGDSNATAGSGGAAANVVLLSLDTVTNNSGSLSARAGTGSNVVCDGLVSIDGQRL